MKSPAILLFLFLHMLLGYVVFSQQDSSASTIKETTKLFKNQEQLQLKLKFSAKNLKGKHQRQHLCKVNAMVQGCTYRYGIQ